MVTMGGGYDCDVPTVVRDDCSKGEQTLELEGSRERGGEREMDSTGYRRQHGLELKTGWHMAKSGLRITTTRVESSGLPSDLWAGNIIIPISETRGTLKL